ncbi:MAG: hydrogenase maturation protease [Clostridiales bacterium]|nr:hydrogenase maturation protease [Clostridiales bacterium]
MKTLVLGLGNEIYGDDGIGIQVIRYLREETTKMPTGDFQNVDLEECSLSGLALLDVIVGYDRLILIDTIKREAPQTGRIHVLRESDIRAVPGPSPHYVSVPQAVEIGRRLGLHMPSRIRVVAVEAKNIHSLGEKLSQEMEKNMPAIAEKVKEVLRKAED